MHAVASSDDDDDLDIDDFPSSSSSPSSSPRLDFAWDPVPYPVGGAAPAPPSYSSPSSSSPNLASAALAGLSSALRAVSSALRLLLPFLLKFGKRRRSKRKNGNDELRIIVPRPRDVARLTLAVVVAAAVLLGAVLFFDAVGERLVTATLGIAKK